MNWLRTVLFICLNSFPAYSAFAQTDLSNNPCENGTAESLLQELGVIDEQGDYANDVTSDCAYLPFDEDTALVAVMQPSTTGDRFAQQGEMDLRLLQIDNDGTVLREGYFKAAGETGGFTLNSIKLDLSLTAASQSLGAIGLAVSNSSHCSACEMDIAEMQYNLFVIEHNGIRWVLKRQPIASESTERAPSSSGCTNAGTSTSSELQLGQTVHHGLKDLTFKTIRKQLPGIHLTNFAECKITVQQQISTALWQFDGQEYQPTKNAQSQTK